MSLEQKNTNHSLRNTVIVTVIITGVYASQASAQLFSDVVVFGASVTDAGNFYDASPLILGHRAPASPPYYMGRASNGPSWVDVLSDELGLSRPEPSRHGGMNFAFASATTGSVGNPLRAFGLNDMDLQVADYLTNHTPTGNELFVFAGTAAINDATFGQEDPAAPVAMLGSLVDQLAQAGAKHVLMSNGIAHHGMPKQDFILPYNEQFNELLTVEMDARRTANPSLQLYEFDAQQTISNILSSPQAYAITNTTDPACRDCGNGSAKNPTDFVENPNEYFFWDNIHFTATVNQVLGDAAYDEVLNSKLTLNEHFDGPLDGWSLIDTSTQQPWGPGFIETQNDRVRFRTTGEVPATGLSGLDATGAMILSRNSGGDDFANGYLRSTFRVNTASNADFLVRGNVNTFSGYLFAAASNREEFVINKFINGEGEELAVAGVDQGLDFKVGEDWNIEVGVVGNVLSLRSWRVGDEEPILPQMVVTDESFTNGTVGLVAAVEAWFTPGPVQLDVSYDELTFLPSVLGDLNRNSILDPSDIDQLGEAIRGGTTHPFYDLAADGKVNELDRQHWVEVLADTNFGDANLDGAIEFSDFLILSEHFGSTGGWASGDFDGDNRVGFTDFLRLSANYGNQAVASVPEPAAGANSLWLLLAATFLRPHQKR